MFFEVWDGATGNLISDYDTQDEALRFVRSYVDAYGPDVAATFTILRVDADGEVSAVATGGDLVAMVTRLSPKPLPRSA